MNQPALRCNSLACCPATKTGAVLWQENFISLHPVIYDEYVFRCRCCILNFLVKHLASSHKRRCVVVLVCFKTIFILFKFKIDKCMTFSRVGRVSDSACAPEGITRRIGAENVGLCYLATLNKLTRPGFGGTHIDLMTFSVIYSF